MTSQIKSHESLLSQWTTNGDAFKIGSDLNKFESETLPQYFRHSRFQSLVRQLNFYNFRKVNRERTFWIYKHDLFHRDRPENLHLLRRRTCPGADGRKNRFSSRTSEGGEEIFTTSQAASSEESSEDDGLSGDENDTETKKRRSKKRQAVESVTSSKRSRRGLGGEDIVGEDDVDSSVVASKRGRAPGRPPNAPRNAEVDDKEGGAPEKAGRTEMLEQSLVVSQVAMKLEEYARKARKTTLARTGRTRGGVVTPPTAAAFDRGLLTYDDEFDIVEHSPSEKGESSGSNASFSPAVITDGDDSLSSEDEPTSTFETNIVSESNSPTRAVALTTLFGSPPITDLNTVKGVVDKIVASANEENYEFVSANAAVIAFCMTTAPSAKDDLCSKVLYLISSTEKLASEFHQYRAALHPLECSKDLLPSFMFAAGYRKTHDVSVEDIWQRDVSRIDAVRDFKTFAVNYFHAFLLQKSSTLAFTESEVSALRYAADVWLRSACASS
jgi:hypothetical protein